MKFIPAITAAAALLVASSANALVVTPEDSGTVLANTILGAGVSISNVNYNGASGASGTFTDGIASGIGIESGVILSSGSAVLAEGPNDASNAGYNNSGVNGNAQLEALSGHPTYDTNVLSFDFEIDGGLGGELYFNMVFGSEEYNEYVNTKFNDVFALFLDGDNIATLDDGTPITINNINNGSNAEFFIDNTAASNNTQMDGFTTVLQISALDIAPGIHTMTFAIADSGDAVLDSWLMIQASSFSNEPTDPNPVPVPASLPLFGTFLAFAAYMRRRRAKAAK